MEDVRRVAQMPSVWATLKLPAMLKWLLRDAVFNGWVKRVDEHGNSYWHHEESHPNMRVCNFTFVHTHSNW